MGIRKSEWKHCATVVKTKSELTPRQQQLAYLMSQGKSDKEIATALGLTEGTVGSYANIMYARLGVGSRHEVAMRVRAGLLNPVVDQFAELECAEGAD